MKCRPLGMTKMNIFGSFLRGGKRDGGATAGLRPRFGISYKRGDLIGQKFEVYRVLGRGGLGVVYLVYRHETKSVYALKTFRDEYLKDTRTRELFRREANVWVDLGRHHYLVRAFFVEKIAGRLYIAMEYVAPDREGLNSLEGYLRRRPPDLVQSLRWSIQFCHGMEYAYSKGVCSHRDIKPANIMISQSKIVRITDFGLASVLNASRAVENFSGGTPYYMPPEQFINFADCDKRSDVYAFGVIMYQMASGGRLPFLAYPRDSSEMEMRRFAKAMYKLHSQSSIPKLDLPLFPIIQRCLEKEPNKRYQTFKEVREDLEWLLKLQTGEEVKMPKTLELEAIELSNKGMSLTQLGRVDEGIATLKQAIELDPDYAEAHNNLGKAYYSKGWLDQATTEFKRAIELDPNDSVTRSNLGLTYLGNGRTEKAVRELKQAIELDPDYAVAHCDLGAVYGKKGWSDKAITEFKEAIKLDPELSVAHSNLGLAYHDKGWLDQAIRELKQAIELDPDYAEAHCDLGAVYGKKGWSDKAITEFKQAIELNPTCAEAHFNLAVAYYNSKRFDLAWKHVRITEKLNIPTQKIDQLTTLLRKVSREP